MLVGLEQAKEALKEAVSYQLNFPQLFQGIYPIYLSIFKFIYFDLGKRKPWVVFYLWSK
jgi:SpoVK/Ycf46/Vps4 family AAA+-type ATPase